MNGSLCRCTLGVIFDEDAETQLTYRGTNAFVALRLCRCQRGSNGASALRAKAGCRVMEPCDKNFPSRTTAAIEEECLADPSQDNGLARAGRVRGAQRYPI
jgi:hypothetical protein